MTTNEALTTLQKDWPSPEEFFFEDGDLHMQQSCDSGEEEPGDMAWDNHCDMVEYVYRKLGEDNVVIVDAWADNNTIGFTIKLK